MRYNRVFKEAHYTIETRATVRQTAKVFGIAKSTVWRDLAITLSVLDKNLAEEVREVLRYNKAARYKRGGYARGAKLKSRVK